jgi:predicted transcriptional regulator
MQYDGKVIEQTADIVTAYISRNGLPHNELPALIRSIHAALSSIIGAPEASPAKVETVLRRSPSSVA